MRAIKVSTLVGGVLGLALSLAVPRQAAAQG
jgi:hypothetical protein